MILMMRVVVSIDNIVKGMCNNALEKLGTKYSKFNYLIFFFSNEYNYYTINIPKKKFSLKLSKTLSKFR